MLSQFSTKIALQKHSCYLTYLTFKVFGLKKATWPEDPALIELVRMYILDS